MGRSVPHNAVFITRIHSALSQPAVSASVHGCWLMCTRCRVQSVCRFAWNIRSALLRECTVECACRSSGIVAESKRHLRTVAPAVCSSRDGPIIRHCQGVPDFRAGKDAVADLLAWTAGMRGRGGGGGSVPKGKIFNSQSFRRLAPPSSSSCYSCPSRL